METQTCQACGGTVYSTDLFCTGCGKRQKPDNYCDHLTPRGQNISYCPHCGTCIVPDIYEIAKTIVAKPEPGQETYRLAIRNMAQHLNNMLEKSDLTVSEKAQFEAKLGLLKQIMCHHPRDAKVFNFRERMVVCTDCGKLNP